MDKENQEEIEKKPLPSEGDAQEETVEVSTEQDPLKSELEKVQKQGGRSKKDKLLYSKKRIEEQLADLGEDPDELSEDDKPVTVGMLKKMQTETAIKTALDLADDITDETERELTKYHLENTIRPTGDPKRDLELAQVHVNAVKNRQIMEETTRKGEPRKTAFNGGGNPKDGKIEEELTAQELSFMRPPFNLSKEQILAARKAQK